MQDVVDLRSVLYVPSDQAKMIDKSLALRCDGLIFDLEDAISIENKGLAREILHEKQHVLNKTEKPIFIRVNGADTEYFEADLFTAIVLGAAGVVIPKGDKESVKAAENYFERNEKNGQCLNIIPLIETAFCLENISETLGCSDRVIAAQFGAEDFTRDLGIPRTSGGDELLYARQRFVIACRARDKGAVDTPYTDLHDETGLEFETVRIKNMGMTGKACIHPNQIETVNRLFTPTDEEILRAGEIVRLFNLEENRSKGVVVIDGKMVDKPILQRAERVLKKAKMYEVHQ